MRKRLGVTGTRRVPEIVVDERRKTNEMHVAIIPHTVLYPKMPIVHSHRNNVCYISMTLLSSAAPGAVKLTQRCIKSNKKKLAWT